ncbi:hypothetical protein SAMN04489717_2856 [Actinopolymorpha singaporensis]|uniref:Uncharacterized protein n=1 Tax=Actinopolymorpha singaporensis TaxID=117157 RepID=A0A1H1SLS7_9ACTN|nr:hypothetical protein SAMN04489717_2856 [Actinopolymorpha singaporensis]
MRMGDYKAHRQKVRNRGFGSQPCDPPVTLAGGRSIFRPDGGTGESVSSGQVVRLAPNA